MSLVELDRFEPILDALRSSPRQYFDVGAVTLRPVSVEVRRGSYLMRLEITGGPATCEAFLKVYRSSPTPTGQARAVARVTRDYAITRAVHDAMRDDPMLGAVWPIGVFPERHAIVTRRSPGLPVGRVISQTARWKGASGLEPLLHVMRGIGRWLPRFQQIEASESSPQRLDDILEYVDIRLQKLRTHDAITEDDRQAARRAIEARWRDVSAADQRTCAIHADYCLGNVLVDGRRIVVLDFAMTRQGARFHDLAHMYMQVELIRLKPWFRPGTIEELGKAMLEGFGPDARPDHPLFQTLSILHVVNHLTKLTIRPGKNTLARSYGWYVRRAHLDWLRRHGCLASSRVA